MPPPHGPEACQRHTQAIFSLSAIVVQSLTNSLGTAVIATSVAVMRVDGFAMMPNFTFGTASTTYTGQNIGAGRLDRIHTGTRDLMKLAWGGQNAGAVHPVPWGTAHQPVYQYAHGD